MHIVKDENMDKAVKKSLLLHFIVFLMMIVDLPLFWSNRATLNQVPIIVDLKDVKISEMTNLPPKAKFGKEDQAASQVKRKVEEKYTKDEDDSSLWGTVKEKIKRNKKSSKGRIMPTEMRLSFQPNRAEISGQTLRWIQAFAKRTAEDKNAAIEIRIDGTNSMELQQKRLNLLHNILTNKGVSYGKINTVFTNREPNSFIIRTISLGNDTSKNNQKGTINRNTGYYLQW